MESSYNKSKSWGNLPQGRMISDGRKILYEIFAFTHLYKIIYIFILTLYNLSCIL